MLSDPVPSEYCAPRPKLRHTKGNRYKAEYCAPRPKGRVCVEREYCAPRRKMKDSAPFSSAALNSSNLRNGEPAVISETATPLTCMALTTTTAVPCDGTSYLSTCNAPGSVRSHHGEVFARVLGVASVRHPERTRVLRAQRVPVTALVSIHAGHLQDTRNEF